MFAHVFGMDEAAVYRLTWPKFRRHLEYLDALEVAHGMSSPDPARSQ